MFGIYLAAFILGYILFKVTRNYFLQKQKGLKENRGVIHIAECYYKEVQIIISAAGIEAVKCYAIPAVLFR